MCLLIVYEHQKTIGCAKASDRYAGLEYRGHCVFKMPSECEKIVDGGISFGKSIHNITMVQKDQNTLIY